MHRIRSGAIQHANVSSRPSLPTSNSTFASKNAQPTTSTPTDSTAVNDNVDGANESGVAGTRTPHQPPAAPPPQESEDAGTTTPSMTEKSKPKMTTRMSNGSKRFWVHTKDALFHSWINVLLVCVPVGIGLEAAGANPAAVFAVNAIAIIPLAGLLTHATESVASRLGDTLGALLNVSFGNAVELIIFIIALVKNEISIVQASLLGSILSNLLLILGMAFLFGGLRYREQIYNSTVTQMSACLLSLAVISLLLPTAFHASFSDSADADRNTLKISRGTSVILLIVYILYLLFQLKSHAYMYESTPQRIIDEESYPGVLADFIESSSSSECTDSSCLSDTDTSESITTTKRIKKAFRNRRHRKSSGSSTHTASVHTASIPSVSSPSQEQSGSPNFEERPNPMSRRGSALANVPSGDEADTDGERETREGEPRIRDFVKNLKENQAERDERRKKRKHRKKHHKRPRSSRPVASQNEEEQAPETEQTHVPETTKEEPSAEPSVQFADFLESGEPRIEPTPRKAFTMGGMNSKQFRPALPKMLSHNVFVTPPPVTPTRTNITPKAIPRTNTGRTQTSGLRRASSLPDLAQRENTPTATTSDGNLPPYQRSHTRADEPADGEDEADIMPPMSRTAAAVLLLISTALVAVCAEFLVDAIPAMVASTPVSQAFIGLIILPIVSNAAEHVTAVTVASKNKMDLAIGVSVGSSIQIALFVTPLVVILGWIIGRDMTLYFNLFETISLFVTVFVVNFLVLDGRSNYLEGSLLIAAYIIIAVAAYFYPDQGNESTLGGATTR